MADRVLKTLNREVEEEALKLSITDRRERREEQRGPRFRECSKQGFVLATSVETLRVASGTRTKQLESKERRRQERSAM